MAYKKRKLELSAETLLQLDDMKKVYGGEGGTQTDCDCAAKDRPCSFKGNLPACGGRIE